MRDQRRRPATAASASPQTCFWCNGTGRIPSDQHERYDRCNRCGGSGVRQNRRLQDVPADEIVAAAA
jgi:DnaJ-class molecular chaperone